LQVKGDMAWWFKGLKMEHGAITNGYVFASAANLHSWLHRCQLETPSRSGTANGKKHFRTTNPDPKNGVEMWIPCVFLCKSLHDLTHRNTLEHIGTINRGKLHTWISCDNTVFFADPPILRLWRFSTAFKSSDPRSKWQDTIDMMQLAFGSFGGWIQIFQIVPTDSTGLGWNAGSPSHHGFQ
jgi:hypothetical protein